MKQSFGQWFPTGALRHPRVSFTILRGAASQCIFQYINKILFSKCHQTLKQIAMGSPVANYISLLWGAANLKILGNTGLGHGFF